MADAPLRLALVTNIPAPYRVPVFDRVAATPGIALRVLYGALREPDRDWDLPPLQQTPAQREALEARLYRWNHG